MSDITIAELEAQRAALDAQIEAEKAAYMAGAIAAVNTLMESSGVTLEMLGGRKARAPRAATADAKPKQSRSTKGVKVAAKYRGTDAEGKPVAWSGRGLQPKWMTAAIAAGATRESLAVTAEAA